jgi:O-antigen ligase
MPEKIIIKIQSLLSWIGLVLPLLALGVVLSSYVVSAAQPYRGPTLFYFYVALLAALLSRKWSTYLLIFCLPLLPGLSTQAELILNPAVKYFVAYPGIDMVAGLFIGQCARSLYLKENLSAWLKPPPWPLGLGLLIIVISTVITISRNLWQSASSFSLNGIADNIFRFKHMGRGNDFLPFTDLLIYSFTILLIICIFQTIKNSENKNDIVFKPVVIGLIVSACWGTFQAITAFGLPAYAVEYRNNTLGFSAFGFQPDIHAFAGHMLIGAVGLSGYILTVKQAVFWKRLTYIACALSWVALFLSKSRASLVLALLFMFIVGLVIAYRKRTLFNKYVYIGIFLVIAVLTWLTFIGKLWIVDIVREIQGADLTNFEVLSRLSVYRLEIFAAALKMFFQFPFMGVGQGNFFHLSSLIDFAGSPWVAKTGGENAHNYFFQTLAELGLVGIASFLIIFIWPIKKTQPFKIVAPAVIAILSLFLGNLYSHSLIIRENLLLLSAFVALLYAHANQLQPIAAWSNAKNYIVLIIASATLVLAFKEIETSYGKPPFIYGSECYKNSTTLEDGWTNGLFVTELPVGSSGIKILIDKNQPNSQLAPLFLNLNITDNGGDKLISVNSSSESNNAFSIEANLKNGSFTKEGARATLKLSKCFTQSNFGLGDESKKLGVHIKQIMIY